jgi:hypothetical protein
MVQPAWRLIRKLKIPAQPPAGALWTPAIDVVESSRLLRITVVGGLPTNWNLSPLEPCSPNGIIDNKTSRLTPNAATGALIGKLGGSTSDLPSGDPPQYCGARLFAVGDHAVIRIQKDEIGALYLTMNDAPADFRQHSGEIEVQLEEMET